MTMYIPPSVGSDDNNIRGRHFVLLFKHLTKFWIEHKLTLAPHMDPVLVSALDTIVGFVDAVGALNPPGPF